MDKNEQLKDKKKQSYQENKEKIKNKVLERYYRLKETINQPVECKCGRVVNKQYLNAHMETHIHKKLMGIETEPALTDYIKCECERIVTRGFYKQHLKKKIHKDLIEIERRYRLHNPK